MVGRSVDQCLQELALKVSELIEPTTELGVKSRGALDVQEEVDSSKSGVDNRQSNDTKIIDINGAVAYVNVGSAEAVKKGDSFVVYSQRHVLRDPETGAITGYSASHKIGLVEIENVLSQHLSSARVAEGVEQIKTGYPIRSE